MSKESKACSESCDGCGDERANIGDEIELTRRLLAWCENGSSHIGDGLSEIGVGVQMFATSFERGLNAIARAMVESAKAGRGDE